MASYDFDLFVIGAGSGGVRASRMAAAAGARVAVAEDRYLGGTCVNVGCVPKKLFAYGAHYHEEFQDAKGFGWSLSEPRFDWPTLRDNKTREIERLNGVYRNLLANSGVELINGRARIVGPQHVAVGDSVYSARYILVATGSMPYMPDFPGVEHAIDSNQAFYLETFPQRALVLGGGYIAVEFAGIFNGLGAETHLVYRRDLFLRGFDRDVRESVRDEVSKKGIQLHFNVNIERIDKQADGSLRVTLTDARVLEVDTVLCATGRVPNTQGLGLDTVNVATKDNGAIIVDEYFQTTEPSIYAIGDVIDRVQLTPVALAEGMALVRNLFTDGPKQSVDYRNIPTAVFCHPNIATVGMTEAEARAAFDAVDIYKSTFRPLKHTLSGRDERCLMKLVVDKATDKVVGAHMVGADAGEVIQGIAIAVKAGLTKADFDATIGIHPTGAEEFVTMREPVSSTG